MLSPQSARAALENGLLDSVVQQYAKAHQLDPRKLKVAVETPQNSDIVVLSAKGPPRLQDALVAIEKNAVSMLARNASSRINAYRAGIQAQMAEAKLALAKLTDPQRTAADKAALKKDWQAAQAELTRLQCEQDVLQKKRAGLSDINEDLSPISYGRWVGA